MTREELTLKAIATYNGNLYSGMTTALGAVVDMVLEEAARCSEMLSGTVRPGNIADVLYVPPTAKDAAAAIRALKEKA